MFIVSTKDPSGTSLMGYIAGSFSELVEIFGQPNGEGDEYKVSTEWILEDSETGDIATIYDYKYTALYDPSYPSVKTFREMKTYDWHIGATNEETAKRLIKQLSKKTIYAASKRLM